MRILLVGAVLFIIAPLFCTTAKADVVVPNSTNVSTSYQNRIFDDMAWGWGNVYGGIIPQNLQTSCNTWYDGDRLHWNATAWTSGIFMPTDGTVTPEMTLYNILGPQNSHAGLSDVHLTYVDGNGQYWAVASELDVGLGFNIAVDHDTWQEPDGIITDYWWGSGNADLNVRGGWITNSSPNFWRTDYDNGRPSEWQAQFWFSGISALGSTTATLLPEPASAALLGLGGLLIRRRR